MNPETLKTVGAIAVVAVSAFVLLGAKGGSVTGEEARALVKDKGAFLLDVRTPSEFAEGHIEGATNIPVQELDAKLSTLESKKGQDIVVYCRSGARSAQAKRKLEAAGFTKVHDLGGMSNWK